MFCPPKSIEPDVVLRVGEDAVGRAARLGERLEQFGVAGAHVHPVDATPRRVLQPDPVVDRPVLRTHERRLGIVLQQVRRQLEHLEGFGFAVELRRARLEHQPKPEVPLRIGLQIERAGRPALPLQRDVVDLVSQRVRVEAAETLTAEIAVPDDAVRIDNDVVRLDGGIGQVVFGDDHAGAGTLDPRQGSSAPTSARLC